VHQVGRVTQGCAFGQLGRVGARLLEGVPVVQAVLVHEAGHGRERVRQTLPAQEGVALQRLPAAEGVELLLVALAEWVGVAVALGGQRHLLLLAQQCAEEALVAVRRGVEPLTLVFGGRRGRRREGRRTRRRAWVLDRVAVEVGCLLAQPALARELALDHLEALGRVRVERGHVRGVLVVRLLAVRHLLANVQVKFARGLARLEQQRLHARGGGGGEAHGGLRVVKRLPCCHLVVESPQLTCILRRAGHAHHCGLHRRPVLRGEAFLLAALAGHLPKVLSLSKRLRQTGRLEVEMLADTLRAAHVVAAHHTRGRTRIRADGRVLVAHDDGGCEIALVQLELRLGRVAQRARGQRHWRHARAHLAGVVSDPAEIVRVRVEEKLTRRVLAPADEFRLLRPVHQHKGARMREAGGDLQCLARKLHPVRVVCGTRRRVQAVEDGLVVPLPQLAH